MHTPIMLKSKRVQVAGAGGFIGSHLVERLVRDCCKVRAMVHYNSSGKWGNLESLPDEVKQAIEVSPGDVTDPFSPVATNRPFNEKRQDEFETHKKDFLGDDCRQPIPSGTTLMPS